MHLCWGSVCPGGVTGFPPGAAHAQWTEGIRQCSGANTDVFNNQLTVEEFLGLFYVLAIFLGAAIVWSCGEHTVVCFARRHPRSAQAISHPFRKVSSHILQTAESFRRHGAGENKSQRGSSKDGPGSPADPHSNYREVALVLAV